MILLSFLMYVWINHDKIARVDEIKQDWRSDCKHAD